MSLDPSVRRVLQRLARRRESSIYIMSGRRLADLRRHANIAGCSFIGPSWLGKTRGRTSALPKKLFCARPKSGSPSGSPPCPAWRLRIKVTLWRCITAAQTARGNDGQTGYVAARNIPARPAVVKGQENLGTAPPGHLGKRSGNPTPTHALPPDTLPIFVGDDVSDESAFSVIKSGLAIHVGGSTKTNAHFCLSRPSRSPRTPGATGDRGLVPRDPSTLSRDFWECGSLLPLFHVLTCQRVNFSSADLKARSSSPQQVAVTETNLLNAAFFRCAIR